MDDKLLRHIVTAAGVIYSAGISAEEKPNIVIILADDMGYGDVSCNNPYARTQTPAIDRIAAAGIRFTDAHSAGALSGPSRYGLVTGRYFFREQLNNEYWGYLPPYLKEDRLTIGHLMQAAGYTTACVGKWHLGLDWALKDNAKPQILNHERFDYTNTDFSLKVHAGPDERGFDYSFILPASLDMPPYVFIENGEVTDQDIVLVSDVYPLKKEGTEYSDDRKHTSETDIYWERGVWWRNGEMSASFRHEACLDKVLEKGLSFISREAGKIKPFFLYLPLTGPHTPWLPDERFKGSSRIGTYGDFISQIDCSVDNVIRTLEKEGVLDNTVIIFCSDNGAAWSDADISRTGGHECNWSRRGQKGDAWDGGHHVPLIVYWPGKIKTPGVYSGNVGLVDIYATLAELTGQNLDNNQAEDSFSFLRVLDGDMDTLVRDHQIYLSGSRKLSIRSGKWKYIDALGSCGFSYPTHIKPESGGPKGQLYDMDKDSLETDNLYMEYPDLVKVLKSQIDSLVRSGKSRK